MAISLPKVDGNVFNAAEANAVNIITVESGEAITAGNIVFVYGNGHANEGKLDVSTTAIADKIRALGIATNTVGGAGSDVYVQTRGVYVTSGLTDKKHYYLGAAGAVSTTTSAVQVGYANGTTELHINVVQDDRDIVGTIKAYLKSHAGTTPAKSAFWKECDGTTISDAESPLNFAGAGEVPDLNTTQRFIRGATTSDLGTDNTAAGASTHGNHGPSFSNGTGGGKTEGFDSKSHLPLCIDVVFIMKIK